jgi:hypothetical protein
MKFIKNSCEKLVKYNSDQNFCVDCRRPINKNCKKSNIMNGKCGSCYRLNLKENIRRTLQKTRDTYRKNQRKFKNEMIY